MTVHQLADHIGPPPSEPLRPLHAQTLDGWSLGPVDSLARGIIESAPDGIMLVGHSGTILLANDAMRQISGYTPQSLVGQSVEIFLPPEMAERHRANVHRLSSRPVARPMGRVDRLALRRRDGSSLPVDISLSQCTADGKTATVVFVRDLTSMRRLEQQMQYQATHDTLTGLVNRWMFNQHLARALAQARRYARPLALLLLDLDNFKAINDGHGHAVGDQVLVEASSRLAGVLRSADILARLGGDEFIVLMPELNTPADAITVAQKLVAALRRPCQVAGFEVLLNTSIGIVFHPDDAQDAETLLRYADMAMYHAKATGRGTYAVYSPSMGAEMDEKVRLHERLQIALDTNALHLHYQPQVDVASGEIVGVEALLRWTDAVLGEVQPERFIPIAEATGLITPLDNWVLDAATRQAAAWARAGTPVRVSINLSARQFRQPALAEHLRARLESLEIAPTLIELEITESEAMVDPQQTQAQLEQLSALGVGVALDDFGTGHSSLAYLREFPITRLKIDRAFVRLIAKREDDATLVRAVLALAHTMGLPVVAEGVEHATQLEFLRQHGCHCYQGWLFSPAVPATQVGALLRAAQPAQAPTPAR